MTGFGGSSEGVLGAETFLKNREESFEVSCVVAGKGAAEESTWAWIFLCFSFISQHFLNFFPEPQGHGSFRPTFCMETS